MRINEVPKLKNKLVYEVRKTFINLNYQKIGNEKKELANRTS